MTQNDIIVFLSFAVLLSGDTLVTKNKSSFKVLSLTVMLYDKIKLQLYFLNCIFDTFQLDNS